MKTRPLTAPLPLALIIAALGSAAAPARAHDDDGGGGDDDGGDAPGALAIAADLDYALPIDSLGDDGGGFAIRVGWQLHVPLLVLTPEVGFSHYSMSGTGEPTITRGFIGARVGLGEIFRFGAFGHVGLAGLSADVIGPDPSHTGFSYDLGLFFDFTLIPFIDLGVHGAWNHLAEDDLLPSYQWITLGAHVALIL